MLNKLGRTVAKHKKLTVLIWTVLLGLSIMFSLSGISGPSLFSKLSSSTPSVQGESYHGREMLGETQGNDSEKNVMLMVTQTPLTPADPKTQEYAQKVASTKTELEKNPAVIQVDDPFSDPTKQAAMMSPSGNGFLVNVNVNSKKADAHHDQNLQEIKSTLTKLGTEIKQINPPSVTDVGGSAFINQEFNEMTKNDLERAEVSSLPIALLVMVIMFGGLIAAGIPLISALVTITCALGLMWVMTFFMGVDTMVVNTISITALGLAVDYGLFIVSRYREEYQKLDSGTQDEKVLEAIGNAVSTSGRTVIFSGLTVALCLSSLLAFEPSLVKNIGFGGMMAVLISILTSIFLIPALLGFFGKKLVGEPSLYKVPGIGKMLAKFGMVAPREGFFSHLTRKVQKHPWVVFLATLLTLLAMAAPALHMKAENSNLESLGGNSPSYIFFNNLEKNFPYASAPYVEIVGNTSPDKLNEYITSLGPVEGVKSFTPAVSKNGNSFSIVELTQPSGNNKTGSEVVTFLRDHRPTTGFNTWITGSEASSADFVNSMIQRSVLAAIIVVISTFTLLFLMTGSVIIPIKALIMSAISLGASLGVLTWGFQGGHFARLLNFNPDLVSGVDTITIVFFMVFGFGLAMDYEMFLISRVKEHHDQGDGNKESVALGLQNSGRIITSAAIIIMTVFIGFTFADLLQLKEMGVALAFAVLLDATLVRCLLVPATMTIMGEKWNWWAPAWMKKIHSKIGVDH